MKFRRGGLGRRAARGAFGQLVARAVPHLLVTAVAPSVCFVVGRLLWGLAGGVMLALAWNVSCQLARRLRREPLSAILLLGLSELVVRTVLAMSLNSTRAYFIVPAVLTAVVGVFCMVSAMSRRPVASRILDELVPRSMLDVDDPVLAGLLRRVSVLYGVEQIAGRGPRRW